MRQIRMSGTDEQELREAIAFILGHQEYSGNVLEITHIRIEKNHIVAYELKSDYFDSKAEKYGKLPLAMNAEGFIATAIKWWQDQPQPQSGSFDGTVKKGFLVSYGKNYGSLDPDEFGYDTSHSKKKDTDVEFDNIHCITIMVNNQYYGK